MLTSKEQIQQIEQKSWYRFLKILAILWLVAAFFIPFYRSSSIDAGLLDGLINTVVWFIMILVLRQATLYVVFGKAIRQDLSLEAKEVIKKNLQKQKRVVLFSVLFFVVFVIVSMLFLYFEAVSTN